MRKINISTKKHPNTFALVDDADYSRVIRYRWHACQAEGSPLYASRDMVIKGKRTSERLHRYILRAKKGTEIDHKNGDGADCQRENLRFCSSSQNKQNQRKRTRIPLSSPYKGVCWHSHKRKWMVRLVQNYKVYFLGYFEDCSLAAKAYDKKAVELFGRFACLNFSSSGQNCFRKHNNG